MTRQLIAIAESLLLGAGVAQQSAAQGVLRIAMTAADVPLTTGLTNQGGEGQRFMGYTAYDSLILWDLSRSDRASELAQAHRGAHEVRAQVKGFVQAPNWLQDFSTIIVAPR